MEHAGCLFELASQHVTSGSQTLPDTLLLLLLSLWLLPPPVSPTTDVSVKRWGCGQGFVVDSLTGGS